MSWRTLTSDPHADPPNCFRLEDKILQNPFSKVSTIYQTSGQEALLISQEVNELLHKLKGPYKRSLLPEMVFTAVYFLYPKGEDLCVR